MPTSSFNCPQFIAVVLLIANILSSCVGLRGRSDGPRLAPVNVGSKPKHYYNRNLSRKDIDYAIANKNFARAAAILYQIDDQDSLEQERYLKTIKEGLGDLFLENLDTDGVLAAMPYYYSLQSFDEADKYISESDFVEKLFDYYILKNYYGAALDFAQTSLQNNLHLNDMTKKKFQNFIQRQFAVNPNTSNLNQWQQRIDGAVTVFVKRGNEQIPYTPIYLPAGEIGSGFFIDNSGSIITNYHVISSQTGKQRKTGHIFVKLASRDELIPARLVGWDPNRDLALLRISRSVPYLLRMNSTFNLVQYRSKESKPNPALFVSNELYAIGAPGGFENSLTSGRVSARGRKILPLTEALQIDVPANPGNSGGPLLNKRGVIEGVVFAKNKNGEGIAFAIPSDTISSVLPRLYLGGKVTNSWLGLLVDEYSNDQGYLDIRYIFPDSPAAESLLKPGMRIVSYRNNNYSKVKSLQNQIANGPTGSVINLGVEDPSTGKILEVLMELRQRPDKPMYRNLGQESTSQLFYALFGAKLQPATNKRNTYEIVSALPYSQVSQLSLHGGDYIQIIEWLIDMDKSLIVAHIRYFYQDNLGEGSKQSVLIEQLDLPNIL